MRARIAAQFADFARRVGQSATRPASISRGLAGRLVVIPLGLILAGCAGGGGSFLTGGPTVGQLKTSLSRVEFENGELEKKLAKLERENRSMEDRLVQEQLDNGQLTARLDDARNLLRDRGVDLDTRMSSRKAGEPAADAGSGDSGFHALPAGQSSRRRKKAPFARIPGPAEPAPDAGAATSGDESASERTSARLHDLERRSDHANPSRWARATDVADDPTTVIR